MASFAQSLEKKTDEAVAKKKEADAKKLLEEMSRVTAWATWLR